MIEDSPRRCPRCCKRMFLDLGERDDGRLEAWHECWNCDYREPDAHPFVVVPWRPGGDQ